MGESDDLFRSVTGEDVPSTPLPAEYDWVRLTDQEAGSLIDLLMLKFDLEFAKRQLGAQLADLASSRIADEEVGLERRARWNAALLAYARSFSSGTRLALDSTMYSFLGPQASHDHDYFMTLRNRHVAHAVSDYEQVQVAVALSRDRRPRFIGVATGHVAEQHPQGDVTRRLLRLVEVALEHVERRAEAEQQRLTDFCRRNVRELALRPRITTLAYRSQASGPTPRPPRRNRR